MDLKPHLEDDVQIAPETIAEPQPSVSALAKSSIDFRAVRANATWQASSFDLAQGLDVKVMHSKLSAETLDRLFRG